MADPESTADKRLAERRQRPDRVACVWCDAEIVVRRRGRLPCWCSSSCRHRAWEQRRAAACGRVAVELVERVVEVDVPVTVTETVEVIVLPRGSAWVDALRDLARQIDVGLVYDRDLPALATQLDQVIAALTRRPGLRTRRHW
ncbi:MAG: hypothetical protein ABJA86_07940 [Nocardioidaceae bacterium]